MEGILLEIFIAAIFGLSGILGWKQEDPLFFELLVTF